MSEAAFPFAHSRVEIVRCAIIAPQVLAQVRLGMSWDGSLWGSNSSQAASACQDAVPRGRAQASVPSCQAPRSKSPPELTTSQLPTLLLGDQELNPLMRRESVVSLFLGCSIARRAVCPAHGPHSCHEQIERILEPLPSLHSLAANPRRTPKALTSCEGSLSC